jgi:hypothetical protein
MVIPVAYVVAAAVATVLAVVIAVVVAAAMVSKIFANVTTVSFCDGLCSVSRIGYCCGCCVWPKWQRQCFFGGSASGCLNDSRKGESKRGNELKVVNAEFSTLS